MIIKEEIKDEKEEEESINLNFFNNIIVNANDISYILQSIKEFLDKFLDLNNNQYKNYMDLFEKFSLIKFKDYIINTPIYKMKISLEEIFLISMNYIQTINKNIEILKLIQNKLVKLESYIKDISTKKFSNNSKDFNNCKEIKEVYDSLMESMNNLEGKVVDEYISKKYEKHISYINNDEKIEDLALNIKFLEKSLYDIFKERKIGYFKEIKISDNKIQKICNIINENFEKYINLLKEQNKQFNIKLENFENNVKKKVLNDKEIKKDNAIFSKTEFISEDNNIHTNKYKLKILKSSKINLKNFQFQKGINKFENDDKNKKNNDNSDKNYEASNNNLKEDILFLNDEDVYEIISKIYSYNFLTLDTSQYKLDIQKGKLEAIEYSKKILLYSENTEENKQFLNKKYDEIIKSINDKILNNIENTESFFIALNNYRSKGKINLVDKFYDILIYIYNKAQNFLLNTEHKKLEDILLILSQTYYQEKEGKKIYIINDIKDHELYKNKNFWKRMLKRNIDEEINNKNSEVKLNKTKQEDIVTTKVIPIINLMKEFNISNDIITEIINEISEIFNCSKEAKEQYIFYMNNFEINDNNK